MNSASATRLILVDGLPGAGKSATAQRLWLHLLANDHRAHWFHEHHHTVKFVIHYTSLIFLM